jgi:hypothetical protein
VVAGLSLFVVFPELGSRWFRLAGLLVGWLARRRYLAMALVGLTSLAVTVALGFFVRMPQPYVHDEFSYLLAGDTFAHGRLTNPPHPMWEHFETFHVIQQPTYASKYPPGQGLALALGQKLTGLPIVGVWISTALACAAVCWMMYAWLPPRWALTGALLTALHPVVIEWSQSYWGGSVALGGGALVIGALGRIWQEPGVHHGVVMALGMAVLAISRPYEGAVLSATVVAVLLWQLPRQHTAKRLAPMVAAFLAVLLLALTATGFYNFRVTGHPLRLPYVVHEATYAVEPLFIWQQPRPEPPYRHRVIRDFHVELALAPYRQQQSLKDWLSSSWERYSFLTAVHFPTSLRYLVLSLLVLTIPRAVRTDSRLTVLLIVFVGFVIGTLPEIFMSYRYTAPAAGLLFVLVLQTLRHVRLWRWQGRPLGRSLVRVSLLTCVLAFLLTTVRIFTATSEGLDLNQWAANRAATIESLKQQGGQHLIIVRYGGQHSSHQEWVYNEADIDNATVVWAREMDPARNRKLLEYFKNRHAWLLDVDDDSKPPHLEPTRTEERSLADRCAQVGPLGERI